MRENWKYVSFEDCLQKVPKQQAVKSKDYLENGLFPIVSQESDLISGYTSDEHILYKHEKPVIIFGDHTKNIKYIDFNFVVGADGVHILSVKDDILPKFFYYELCSIKLRNLGYARHYKLLKEKEICYPDIAEQERIVALLDAEFAKIDALKANAASQLQAAKDLFQSALKEMLTPKEGWEEKTLGEICDILDSKRKPITKNKRVSGSIPYYGATGVLDYVKDYIFDEKLVLLGEDGAKWGAGENSSYIICGKSWVNNHAHALKPHRNIILDEFLVYYLNYSDLSESITGVTVPKLNQEKMRAIVIPIPSLSEQERIAARLDAISEKVKALQANYDQTITLCNDLKQSLLKSIFA